MRIFLAVMLAAFSTPLLALKLTLWEHEREEIQKVLDEVITKFTALNKDIKIKRSHYKTEDLRTQYQTAALGGGGADLVIAPNDFAGPLAIMGIVKPVNELIGKEPIFFDSVLAAIKDEKGTTWGLPIANGNHLMLFINKKIVKKAPISLEDLVKTAKAHTGNGKYGFAYNLNEPFWFVTFLAAYGEVPLKGAAPNLDNSAMIEALQLVKDLKFKDKVVPTDCDYACADTLFVERKAAMIINGDWSVHKYKEALKEDLLIAPLPMLGKTGKYMQPMVSGKYLFFNNKLRGKKWKAAKKFASYLVSLEVQELMAAKGGRLPSVKAAATSKAVTDDPVLSASLNALKNGQPMPMAVEMRAVWDAIRPQLQGVMAGRLDPKVASAAMQKDATTKIKEMKQ